MDGLNKLWRFCAVGNIVEQHSDEDGNIFYGTKAFIGGTKVYINDRTKGLNDGKITVIGLNRFKKYAVESVPIKLIENVRLERVYKPNILDYMDYLECMEGFYWRERTADDKRSIEAFIKELNE